MTARLYVGTYAKYNAGSIAGAWLNLSDYADREAFLAACAELHKDETDPELMFQDFEGFPKAYYSEGSVSEELFDWLELDEEDQSILAAYCDAVDNEATIETARDAFHGIHENPSDFAYDWYEQTGELDKIPESLRCHIDWEGVARDFGYEGWTFHRGATGVYVFAP